MDCPHQVTRLKPEEIIPGKKGGKSKQTLQTDNMASNSIAAELLGKISEIGGNTSTMEYKNSVAPLSVDDKLPDHVLQHLKKKMKGRYVFNMDRFSNRRGTLKPNGMFELFTKYTAETTKDIRQRMIDYVHSNVVNLKEMTVDYFKAKHGDIMMWAYRMSKETTPGDELALFILCRIYYRHAVIHTINNPWCTMKTDGIELTPDGENECDIVLVFGTFGFYEAEISNPSQTKSASSSQTVAAASSTSVNRGNPKTPQRKTVSITDLLERVQAAGTVAKKVSDRVDTSNVLPEGHKNYNTRTNTPFRRRQSLKPQRDNRKNKNYSDNVDEFHLERPVKRQRKQSVPSKLRSPSRIRLAAQEKINTERSDKIKTEVKTEDKKAKIKDEEEEAELRKIEARNRKLAARKKWPTDARLVHMDGTECSEHCMRTSIYHKDLSEISTEYDKNSGTPGPDNSSNNELDAVTILNKTSNSKQEPLKTVQTKPLGNNDNDIDSTNLEELGVATTVECAVNNDNSQLGKLDVETVKGTNAPDITEQLDATNDEESRDSSHSTTDENPLELQKVKKKYNITRAKGHTVPLDDTLPDIESTETPEFELPGATTYAERSEVAPSNTERDPTLNQINKPTKDTVSMDDSLPLLEQPNYYEDLEDLMAIENDQENSELVPIGGPPTADIVKDLNEALGINGDLEIAMDNAQFIETQGSSVAPSNTKKNKTKEPGTPGSPKGTFNTKTHGIRRLTPEEKQSKLFKCEACTFTAYSRRAISDHYQRRHGKVQCVVCSGYFSNPHALKRHMYDHSDDKQFQCKDCDELFYFNSELTAHRMKHRTRPAFRCMAPGCSKTFFRNSDLNAHVPVHSGKIHKCDYSGCDYSNADQRLLKGHKRIHSKKKTFNCKYENCNWSFKHTMSRLRHYRNLHGEL